jgi:hypothetical protein
MSNFWNNQVMLPAPELIETMTGSNVLIGSLLHNPVKIIFDNQSSVPVVLSFSFDGGSSLIQWKTFPAGEAIVLDDDLYSFPKGTQFFGNGASGDFSIAYCYLKQ